MKVKTSELSGVQLDYAVAVAMGERITVHAPGQRRFDVRDGIHCSAYGCTFGPRSCFDDNEDYSPSNDWSQCGPLIEQFQIFIDPPHEVHKSMVTADGKPKGCWESYDTWHATISTTVAEKPKKHLWADFSLPGGPYRGEGVTPQVAICRAVVSAKLGDEVEIPDELMEVRNV